MKRIGIGQFLFIVLMCVCLWPYSYAIAMHSHMRAKKHKKAIVLANFGTTYPSALLDILNIKTAVERAFPDAEVKIAFTSNIIRNIWHKRQHDSRFLAKHKDIPKEILYVKGPLATIADLQDEGYKTIIVQPTHVYSGEEYMDLSSYVHGLNSIKTVKPKYMPFKKLILGRPLLGTWGPQHDYHKDLKAMAVALAEDVKEARASGSALVYMGHGNEYFSTGAYIELQEVMRKMYPSVPIFIGTVEGFPSLDDVVSGLLHWHVKKVILRPLMIVAGDHARNDMAGDDKESWKNVIASHGIHVRPGIHGLGEKKTIADIIVRHIRETAADHGIVLDKE